jgi:hypothetical protein
MQSYTNYNANSQRAQAWKMLHRGRGEGIGSEARYIAQLRNMLQTARRNNWALVVFSLSALIARRGGVA